MKKPSFLQAITLKELPTTVEACRDLIKKLVATFSEVIQRVELLERENALLKEQLTLNSSNSSLPSSKDRFKRPKKDRPSSGRPSGGQLGHAGHHRQMRPTEEADAVVKCVLPSYCACGGEMELDGTYQRHQVYELPEIKLSLTEYQLEKGRCNHCRQTQIASLPSGVTWGMTGPRLTSFMAILLSKYQLSRRSLQAFLKEHYQFKLSVGTVFNKQRIINAVLETPVAGLLEAMKEGPWLNVDETGHKRDGKRQWMWGTLSSTMAYFLVQSGRGKKVLRGLLGDFKGFLISDRLSAYTAFDASQRQLCWAHLKRDFRRLSEKRDRVVARIGKGLLKQEEQLFSFWNRFKRGELTREELCRQCHPIQKKVHQYLEKGTYTDPTLRAVKLCQNVLKHAEALWTFLHEEGVEPTNNHAERCLRPLVIWRKRYFGTRSDYGSEFVARTSSLLMTCTLQSKNAFDYLSQATRNYFAKLPVPALTKY
jgi:transposase